MPDFPIFWSFWGSARARRVVYLSPHGLFAIAFTWPVPLVSHFYSLPSLMKLNRVSLSTKHFPIEFSIFSLIVPYVVHSLVRAELLAMPLSTSTRAILQSVSWVYVISLLCQRLSESGHPRVDFASRWSWSLFRVWLASRVAHDIWIPSQPASQYCFTSAVLTI